NLEPVRDVLDDALLLDLTALLTLDQLPLGGDYLPILRDQDSLIADPVLRDTKILGREVALLRVWILAQELFGRERLNDRAPAAIRPVWLLDVGRVENAIGVRNRPDGDLLVERMRIVIHRVVDHVLPAEPKEAVASLEHILTGS